MPKFRVLKREVWIQPVDVEARDETDAINQVLSGTGEIIQEGLEYSHTLDAYLWTVEERQPE